MYYFDTYIGAAQIAYEHHLISKAGLLRVISEARSSFTAIKFKSEKQRQDRLDDLNRDIRFVNRLLPKENTDYIL